MSCSGGERITGLGSGSLGCGVKPNSKSIVILIESFNIMENVRVGLRQSKLGQNVEILYLNVNRTEKIRDSSDLQSLSEPNS